MSQTTAAAQKAAMPQIRDKAHYNWPVTVLLIIGCVTIFFPLYMAVVIAFKQPSEMTNDIAGALSLPSHWSLSNFAEAMRVTDFWHSLGNSFLITAVTVVLSVVIHGLGGYAIGRSMKSSKVYNFLYLYIVSGMFVPFAILMMPLVKQTAQMGIANRIGVIVLKDLYEEIYVTLLYGVFEEDNIITRAAVIENRGAVPVQIGRVMSMALDFPEGHRELISFRGKHALERQYERAALRHGITEISSTRGTSSHQQNPFVILCDADTTEDFGECCAVSLLYSGSFRMQAEIDQFDSLRIACGLNDDEFAWTLENGGSFAAPEAVLSYTDEGLSGLSNGLQRAYRAHLIRSPWKSQKRPVLINNWEGTYFNFTGERLLEIAQQAAALGLELFVLDDGWFGKRGDDRSGLGDWYVNEKKLGCTLGELAGKINRMGLKFGIWVELEMISEDSDLYRAHPDWALTIPGRDPNRSRSQLVLDLSRREVLDYIKKCIDDLFGSAHIEYIKWDMNRSVGNVFSAADPALAQGALCHRYVLGLYELMDYMLSRQPGLLLEGCSGGGGRFDAGMLYYAPQIWCSDNTDAIERLRIHYGTSFGYPMSAVAAHVSACPNHQNGRVVPFKTRGICAMQGSFGYELDLCRLTSEEREEAKRQIEMYRAHWELFQSGSYYRLTSPFEDPDLTAWSYVSPDQANASLSVVYTDLHANPKPHRVKWKGLQADALYELEGKLYSGAALMRGGTVLPKPECSYDSYMTVIRKKFYVK